MKKQYLAGELSRVREIEIDILREFAELCESKDWHYLLTAGSLLGAVRHKGMIPWDDDIDVAMPRKDYEEFVKYATNNMSNKYYCINTYNYPEYPLFTTQLARKGTSFRIAELNHLDIPFGIYLDIFPYDCISEDIKEQKKQISRAWILGKIMIVTRVGKPYVSFVGIKKKLVHCITSVMNIMLRMGNVTPAKMYRLIMKNTVSKSDTMYFLNHTKRGCMILCTSDFEDYIRLEFEGMMLRCAKDYDRLLTNRYGDYMTLPPVEKRKTHCPVELILSE